MENDKTEKIETKKFTWVSFYKELAQRIIPYRTEQQKLIEILKSIKEQGIPVISLEDEYEKGIKSPLTEIDPFTFFASFNRTATEENRKKILENIKEQLKLEPPVPIDFDGIPIVLGLMSWFLPYAFERKHDDVDLLWQLAEQAVTGVSLNEDLFNKCLKIKMVGLPKLTVGLYWLASDRFLPMDSRTKSYLSSKGIDQPVTDFQSYQSIIYEVGKKLGNDFVNISRLAYLASDDEFKLIAGILKLDMAIPFAEWKKKVDKPIKPFFKNLNELLGHATQKLGSHSVHTRTAEYDHSPRSCLTRAKWKFLTKQLPFKDKDFSFQVQLGDPASENPHTITWGLVWWGNAEEADKTNTYLGQIKSHIDYLKVASTGPGAPGTTIQIVVKRYTDEEILNLDPKYDLKGEIVQDLSSLADELEKVISKDQKSNPDHLFTKLLQKKKQIILYGPPGTGKTYCTRSMAVSLITGETQNG